MPSSDPPKLADLKTKAESLGIPVTVKPAHELNTPDHSPEVIGASARTLDDIMRDPEGEPVRHTRIDAEKRHEEVTPATSLDPSYAWFFLGFAYALIPGLDRSLIEVYQAAGNITIPVRTHKATAHIADVANAHFERNPWAWLIQGIPQEHAEPFKAFVASYRFKWLPGGTASAEVTRPEEQIWLVDWMAMRVRDPAIPVLMPVRGVTVEFAIPVNETTQRGLQIQAAPGLLLKRPVFGVQDLARGPNV